VTSAPISLWNMKNSEIKSLVDANVRFVYLNKLAEKKLSLSLVQYHTLSLLVQFPAISPQVLAEKAGIHPSSLTQTIKRLEKKKLLFSTENPKDSRKKLLGITPLGKEMLLFFENGVGGIF